MTLTLRTRIWLTLLPLLAILALLGTSAIVLLQLLGGSVDAILRENYDSVRYMDALDEALQQIDTSFQLAMVGRAGQARAQYDASWQIYHRNLLREQQNITLPGEAELVEQLTRLSQAYRSEGDDFYQAPEAERSGRYFAQNGLATRFQAIKQVAARILTLNQQNMEEARAVSQRIARTSLFSFAVGLVGAILLAVFLARKTVAALLAPVQTLTYSVQAIGSGNLDQIVAVESKDELGLLGQAFNQMARQLREYRRSDYARLLRAQQLSRALVDSFPFPVLLVDNEGRVEITNRAGQHLLGLQAGSEIPWTPPASLRQPLAHALQRQERFFPERFDHVLTLHDSGEEIALLPRITPVTDEKGTGLGAAVLLIDVTRFRLLDQVKSDLVASVSHQLKTPLTGIRLAVHLLLEERIGYLNPKQTELLLDARDHAERLLGMVNNLLDLARLEEGKGGMILVPEAPATLLRAAADAIRPRAEDKDVKLIVEASEHLPPIDVDGVRFQQVINNLLDNALEHTNSGGRITVSAYEEDQTVVLQIADTGAGIPPEHLPHIYDRFYRIPGHEVGTGLGLAISREIVMAHHGTIDCQSTVGVGTTFTIRLPRGKRP